MCTVLIFTVGHGLGPSTGWVVLGSVELYRMCNFSGGNNYQQALNSLSIHVTFAAIVPRAYPGESKMWLQNAHEYC